jgi:hypothetical protein
MTVKVGIVVWLSPFRAVAAKEEKAGRWEPPRFLTLHQCGVLLWVLLRGCLALRCRRGVAIQQMREMPAGETDHGERQGDHEPQEYAPDKGAVVSVASGRWLHGWPVFIKPTLESPSRLATLAGVCVPSRLHTSNSFVQATTSP